MLLCKKLVFLFLLSFFGIHAMRAMDAKESLILYKILTLDEWATSENSERIVTASYDNAFIHFSLEHQVAGVVKKKFLDSSYVILSVDPTKLIGELRFEWDSKKTDQYYHLHNGYIPAAAVERHEIITQK
jgi:uncharacterized protein (DUF952 family)